MGYSISVTEVVARLPHCGESGCGWTGTLTVDDVAAELEAGEHRRLHDELWRRQNEEWEKQSGVEISFGDLRPRGRDRRRGFRRGGDLLARLTADNVILAAEKWRHSEAGDSRTAAALALRTAVDDYERAIDAEGGAASSSSILGGLAATGAVLLFWYGAGSWLGVLGSWLGSGALGVLAWRHWHQTATPPAPAPAPFDQEVIDEWRVTDWLEGGDR